MYACFYLSINVIVYLCVGVSKCIYLCMYK